jgi:predicted NUDIX family NTP pyrophosphohydrolase
LAVFLAHMGGPFWARRDDGGWSVPKGEFDPEAEDPARAARREFAEEIGVAAPDGPMLDLGTHPQPSGKRIRAFAVRADPTLQFVASNTFALQWPPGSGRVEHFPEVDRAQWFGADAARRKLVPGQVTILEALQRALGGRGPGQGP